MFNFSFSILEEATLRKYPVIGRVPPLRICWVLFGRIVSWARSSASKWSHLANVMVEALTRLEAMLRCRLFSVGDRLFLLSRGYFWIEARNSSSLRELAFSGFLGWIIEHRLDQMYVENSHSDWMIWDDQLTSNIGQAFVICSYTETVPWTICRKCSHCEMRLVPKAAGLWSPSSTYHTSLNLQIA